MTALELKRIIDMPGFLAWPGCHLTCRYTLRRLSRLPLQLLSFVGPGSQLKAWPPCKNARKHPRNFGTIDQLMCYIVAKILCPLGNRGPHTHTHPHTPTHTHTHAHTRLPEACVFAFGNGWTFTGTSQLARGPVYPFLHLSIYLSSYPPIPLSQALSLSLSLTLSVPISLQNVSEIANCGGKGRQVHRQAQVQSFALSVCLIGSVCLSVCLSVSLSPYIDTYINMCVCVYECMCMYVCMTYICV